MNEILVREEFFNMCRDVVFLSSTTECRRRGHEGCEVFLFTEVLTNFTGLVKKYV